MRQDTLKHYAREIFLIENLTS
uniref:Uncharacterized protein n=1 Tax=Anguilla anguilla TaxID=7936 RepID=A0A0E9XZX1_ANGAN